MADSAHPMGTMSKHWTTADIPDQTGETAIITGGNSGIGYYSALDLARKGANVLLAVRSLARGEEAARQIRAAIPHSHVDAARLDLASQSSVHDFARNYLGSGRPLHLLINNAGVMALPKRVETEDGFEMQFGTNVLGHFALTGLLLPALNATAKTAPQPPRIVTIASIKHLSGRINLADLQATSKYSPGGAYGQSKLGDLMFALELDRRLCACGSRVMSLAAHPGVASTNLFLRDAPKWQRPARKAVGSIIHALLNSAGQGALPTLYAATSPDAKSGGYYGPKGFFEMRGPVGEAKISQRAQDTRTAAALWEKCEQLTGVRFP